MSALLLDTHTFLWFINGDKALSSPAKEIMENAENILYLSVASLWEMAIKISLGRLEAPYPFDKFIEIQLRENSITLLQITPVHTGIVAALPFHHRDPFDRLIIAQSLSEGLPIIGKDDIFDEYGVQRHW
jgi:PIN domain nuclease of toxin-antitoxin system